MNTHFCNNIEGAEGSDASNFDKRVREFEKETLDAVKVMRMSNSSRSAVEGQASLLSCDSSHPQNKNDGSQIRRSPKL